MSPRTGRPKSENPKTEKVSIYLTKDKMAEVKEARSKDPKPQKSLAAWFTKKFFEMFHKKNK